MDELLKTLAEHRQLRDAAADKMKAVIEAAKKTFDYEYAQKAKLDADTAIAAIESEIRTNALALYAEKKEKKVFPGVNIKVFQKCDVSYDPQKAKAWALTNMTAALKLETAKFDKAAMDGDVPAEIATVTKYEEPQAQIDSDLSGYLPKEQKPPADFIPRFMGDSPEVEASRQ